MPAAKKRIPAATNIVKSGVIVSPDNQERGKAARDTLDFYERDKGTDKLNRVTDLLADLMHYCAQNGMTFDNELRKARDHFAAEAEEAGTATATVP